MSETYFLGAVSGGMFRTEFQKVILDRSCFTYILKGGAGTGKSTMMKRIAAHFGEKHHIVRYCCSSDPGSLDAVVIPDLHTAVCDGTSPHVFEPVYPGVCQKYVDLGQLWDAAMLAENAEGIVSAADRNRSLLARAGRFTSAAADIRADIFGIGADCLLRSKLEAFIGRLTKKLIPKHGSGSGEKRLLRLTALTEHGLLTFSETFGPLREVFILRDDHFAAGDCLLSRLADEACSRGYDVILSPDQLLSDAAYQHLIIPELGLGMISGCAVPDYSRPGARVLNLMRFYDRDMLRERRTRLRLDRAAAADLMTEAASTLKAAKAVHDELESFYIPAMDHKALDALTEQIIAETELRVCEP
ncbi:MAG: ATPase [Ruminococcus sp.]|nr:ATPase [Ruminococcus sp.]